MPLSDNTMHLTLHTLIRNNVSFNLDVKFLCKS